MVELTNPITGRPVVTPNLPESPLAGSSYLGAAVTGKAFGKGNPGISGSSAPPPSSGVIAATPVDLQPASEMGDGVFGTGLNGVHGQSTFGCGVLGENTSSGFGVSGQSTAGTGVYGLNGAGSGSKPKFGCGVFGDSTSGYGVYGASKSASAIYGTSPAGHLAGEFDGDISVTGNTTTKDLTITGTTTGADFTLSGNLTAVDVILSGADCAEEFDVQPQAAIEPGSVVVFNDDGALNASHSAYDKRVAGIISGAGSFRPAVILDRRITDRKRLPVALVGKVYCKVDAAYAPIEVGDFLTTSPTTGHAMKVQETSRAFGCVIGKALAPFSVGQGMIPVLVALQ